MTRALALMLAVAGCGGRGVVEVDVTSNGVIAGVDHLQVTMENGGQTAKIDVPLPGRPVAISASAPQSFALAFDKGRSGSLDVTVEADDSAGHALASGHAVGTIDPGKNTQLTVVLPGGALPDGGSDDGGEPDMATPPIMPRGQVLLADAVFAVQGGNVRLLFALPAMPVSTKHDYTDRVGTIGCVADHYDPSAGDVRSPDLDAGDIGINGWTGGMTLTGAPVQPRVTCQRFTQGFYQCAYGDFWDPANDVFTTYLDPMVPLFNAADQANVGAVGGPDLPPWNLGALLPPVPLSVQEPLDTIAYFPMQDATLHYDCPGSCSQGLVVAVVILMPDANMGSNTLGFIQCIGPASANRIVIPGAAIGAARAGDPSIKQAVTVVFWTDDPLFAMDTNGQPAIAIAAGRGVGGFAPQP